MTESEKTTKLVSDQLDIELEMETWEDGDGAWDVRFAARMHELCVANGISNDHRGTVEAMGSYISDFDDGSHCAPIHIKLNIISLDPGPVGSIARLLVNRHDGSKIMLEEPVPLELARFLAELIYENYLNYDEESFWEEAWEMQSQLEDADDEDADADEKRLDPEYHVFSSILSILRDGGFDPPQDIMDLLYEMIDAGLN